MPINKRCRHKSPQGGEAGFTIMEMIIVVVISSILGIFVFGVLNKCLLAQRDMQRRKERSDDAIMSMERMNKDLREANYIYYTGPNMLIFKKNVTSSTDTNPIVEYVRDIPTNRVMRQSAASLFTLPGNSTSGSVIATNVLYFYSDDVTFSRVFLEMKFANGSTWQTHSFPRNYGL